MMRLFALAKKSKDPTENNSAQPRAAHLRMLKDLAELSLPNTCETEFPDTDDILHFFLTICPDEGYYRGGSFRFEFTVGDEYPFVAPKIKCLTKIYHPNIDTNGNVCLNILRDDWKPVLSINSIVCGLQHLLLEPNPDDPLNKEAANMLRADQKKFAEKVYCTLRSCSNTNNHNTNNNNTRGGGGGVFKKGTSK